MTDLGQVLGPGGLLASEVPGFSHRSQQQAMAERIAAIMEDGGVLICEAGTGTGKTYAYLVPALLSGRKVLISTGTRNLQDQLFHRDLPLIRKTLNVPVTTALLKGRANYLCRHRLRLAQEDLGGLDLGLRGHLKQVVDWSKGTKRGDIAELPIPEDAVVWPLVTSTTDNCLGQDCEDWQACHLVHARRQAQEADVVVVNHHLFCADLALKDEGFGEILPGADCFVLDEAHQLPEIATNFFGISLSGRQLQDLARDTDLEIKKEASDAADLRERTARLKRAAQDVRARLGDHDRRGPWHELAQDAELQRALESVERRLQALITGLAASAGRGKGLDAAHERAKDLLERLSSLTAPETPDSVRWFETQGRGFRLHQTPLEVADLFRDQIGRKRSAWVFTSATLAVGHGFDHFARQLGIEDAETDLWDSPFDYPNQALWFVPRGLPQPSEPDYNRSVLDLACEIIGYSRGRAFLLFTSHRALRETAAGLEGRIQYPILVQGTAPRAELVERFRQLGNAVLLGTSSFWEGVDVRGDALSCVLIDRLPFASPGDPVLSARIDALRQQGGNPFRDHQLPRAVIALKQGAGRLIRGNEDRGVLVVCDPRLLSRSYGYTFLDSLPAMARTRDIAVVKAFFEGPDTDLASSGADEAPDGAGQSGHDE
ncbi:ATP-dependent DNA helicase [Thiorhodococcus mannitoliphagus]|uniref:ATP-dependent DNA helicase n=1 Tax=Thiorhodococcus mannitoliphagus TaxID=329406 RepID=A0A6P1DWN3_9GAMM|nr:ATP-dependent DNA helicase [Thiorhodococcus mannitoliphagus]NEX20065.1 ATP-dependent DNA helicase [Thiorhodococcus mannitoliphagus]